MKERENLITECQECVGSGWHDILRLLINDLFKLGWDGEVLQVKEKFGGLCFYIGTGSEAIYDRIHAAEGESLRTCEKCGAPGVLRHRSWLKTLCDEHNKQRREECEGDV